MPKQYARGIVDSLEVPNTDSTIYNLKVGEAVVVGAATTWYRVDEKHLLWIAKNREVGVVLRESQATSGLIYPRLPAGRKITLEIE